MQGGEGKERVGAAVGRGKERRKGEETEEDRKERK